MFFFHGHRIPFHTAVTTGRQFRRLSRHKSVYRVLAMVRGLYEPSLRLAKTYESHPLAKLGFLVGEVVRCARLTTAFSI